MIMASKIENNSYMPGEAVPPGETIKDNMIILGLQTEALAEKLGITPNHICDIIKGTVPITNQLAVRLEAVFGPSARFWINLVQNYMADKARLE